MFVHFSHYKVRAELLVATYLSSLCGPERGMGFWTMASQCVERRRIAMRKLRG